MIGVACKNSERDIVREFFELFKTPWEFFVKGNHYEIIISTVYEMPPTNAGLLILYSSKQMEFDTWKGIALEAAASSNLNDQGVRVPIYAALAGLPHQGCPLLYDQSGSTAVALKFSEPLRQILRVGYDLFDEVAFLLLEGQPRNYALIPTLELHISLMRSWILNAGIPLVEIPPVPWGYKFTACLTHDVDFAGIRLQKLDHTMWGFLYRASVGSFLGFLKGSCSLVQMMKNWKAVFSLPLVYLGVARDFWDDFERYA
jgi:hypothetical protein